MIKTLERKDSALLVIDVQERLFPHIDRHQELLRSLQKAVRGFQALQIPLFVTEQVPEKMGPTVLDHLPKAFPKSAFSCLGDPQFHASLSLGIREYVLAGIETHVCVLQTARDFINEGYRVTVLQDAVGSRSEKDYLSALEEMRGFGVRLSSVETILFELLRGANAPEFRTIRDIVK